jgi:hypothetical protein
MIDWINEGDEARVTDGIAANAAAPSSTTVKKGGRR